MKIEYIREFIELIQSQSFSRTAEKYYLSRSALTKHISALEDELEIPLINHEKKGLELTEAGEYMLNEFQKMMDIYNHAEVHLQEIKSGTNGNLRIGLMYYAIDKYFLPLIKKFRTDCPNITLRTVSGQPDQIYNDILNNSLDAGFVMDVVSDISYYNDTLESIPIITESMVLVCRSDHFIASNKSIGLSALSGLSMIQYENGEFMKKSNERYFRWFQSQGVNFKEIITLENIDLLSAAIAEYHAVAIVPEIVLEHHPSLSYIPIESMPKINTCLIYKKANSNPALSLFLKKMPRVYL